MKKFIFRKVNKDTCYLFILLCFAFGVIVWTLQAVNYLDYVTQDGHGLKTYFLYTLFNLPKIIHRLIPFVFFISLFFILTNYESKNELLIFWSNGISKIEFANKLITFAILLLIFQIFLGSYVSPSFQLKARYFLKNSNISFFTSLIKEGKFINAVDGLTFFIDKKKSDGVFENIYIDDSSKQNTKMIYAKNGEIIDNNNQKIFRLYNGEVINKEKSKINVFKFEQIDFGLSKYSTNTMLTPKIQEIPSKELFLCFLKLYKDENFRSKNNFFNCEKSFKKEINQELLKRFYKPLYIPIIALVCCFLVIFPKINFKYYKNRRIIFLSGFVIIIISETSLRYAANSNTALITYLFFPWILFILTYLFFYLKIKNV